MTSSKLRELFVQQDETKSVTELHFLLLSVLLSETDETLESNDRFLTKLIEEFQLKKYWHRYNREKKLELSNIVAEKLYEMGYKEIPNSTTILSRISRAINQLKYYSERNPNPTIQALTLKQMIQAARLFSENDNSKKVRLTWSGELDVR